ncbi:MAG: ATP-dependent helicase [Thermodesulfobacteriota bacterium]
MTILKNLNPRQAEAAMCDNGPLLILAGAGSGKTRVLAYRMAHLILEKGIRPANILTVTFTNKAAGEMRERLTGLIGALAGELWLGTFHSIGLRVLRIDGQAIGVERGFTICNDSDQLALVKGCMKDLMIGDKATKPRVVLALINRAKNRVIGPELYAEGATDFIQERIAKIYTLYQKRLRENMALDFGDLICEPIRLFEEHPDVLERYQSRFHHILVDEYQDTNQAQYRLIRHLAEGHRNLCVVGDPDQSIYCWRGADISNILDFERDYSDATTYTLEQNYRSTANILAAANSVVKNNCKRIEKSLWTENAAGEKVVFEMARDEHHEAELVAEKIVKTVTAEPSKSYRDFAVFYRTNAQSRVLEEYFIRNSIPYTIVGGLRFYERKEIKDAVAYLKVVVNPHDSISLLRIINTPLRGIGKTTIERVTAIAREMGASLYDGLKEALRQDILSRSRVAPLVALIERLHGDMGKAPPSELCLRILQESGYMAMWEKEATDEAESRVENLHELVAAIKDFDASREDASLLDFLDQVALISDIDSLEEEHNRITLMTLHSAKGLEFPVVFVVGMEEGLFPHSRSLDEDDQMEEERRLCYVGMTRAMERLFLLCARQRNIFGEYRFQAQSRFIDEIEPDYLTIENDRSPTRRFADDTAMVSDEPYYTMEESQEEEWSDGSPWRRGMRVRHPSFGLGKIERCEGAGETAKLTVAFATFGIKKLIAKYASLTPIGV